MVQIMKKAANMWETKVDINAIIAKFVSMKMSNGISEISKL